MDTTSNLLPILKSFASKVLQRSAGFVGTALFPLFPTKLPAASYWVLADGSTIEQEPSLKRSPGAGFARSSTRLSSDNYNCELYGHEEPVSDEENAKYARPGAALIAATRRAQTLIMLAHEIRSQAIVTGGGVPSAAVAVPWADAASDPFGDVNTARRAVFDGCALEANVMAVSRTIYEALKSHPKIRDAIKISGDDSRWPELLAAYFDVDKLAIARAVVNNAQEGQAIAVSEVWGNSAILAHVDQAEDFEAPSFGRTFIVSDEEPVTDDAILEPATPEQQALRAVNVDVYRQENLKSNIVRAEQWTAEELTAPSAGFILTGC